MRGMLQNARSALQEDNGTFSAKMQHYTHHHARTCVRCKLHLCCGHGVQPRPYDGCRTMTEKERGQRGEEEFGERSEMMSFVLEYFSHSPHFHGTQPFP